MTGYLLRRTGQALVVILFVTMIVFGLEHLLPGGPARAILGQHATPSNIAAFNRQNGLRPSAAGTVLDLADPGGPREAGLFLRTQ